MKLKRRGKIVLIVVGVGVVLAGSSLLWSANYAGASYLVLKSATMWKSFFGGDMLLPVRQALAYAGDLRVKKIITLATAATIAESAILGGLAMALVLKPWAVKPPADGSRLANVNDLEAAGLLDGKPGFSVLLGTFGKSAKEVRYSGDSHFFVNGPSRAGKGRGFVMTNLLEYRGSAIVLDVKLENWNQTGPARLALGQRCFLFAPGSAVSHRWNPLDFVRGWPERSTDLINLAASLITLGEREDPYWKQTARGLFAGVLGYVLESKTMEGRRDLRSALRMFSTGKSFSVVLKGIIDSEPDLNQFIVNSFRQHLSRDDEQRPSFEGHITTCLSPWNNLLMAASTAQSDFDIRDLRKTPYSLYIGAPVSDFGTVEPIVRLLIQQIHDVMLRELPGEAEPYKVLLMLDEFYQFERLPEIIKRAPLVAGYGLTIALVAQNIPQIDERYGVKTRDALLGNMDIQLYIGVGDDTTAKIVSENMGRQYVEREGWGRGGGLLGKTASQGRFELFPLMAPDAVRRLDPESTLLQIRGSYTAILSKLNFYADKKFVERRREVAGKAGELPRPQLREGAEWPLFTARPPNAVLPSAIAIPPAPAAETPIAAPAQSGGPSLDDLMLEIEGLTGQVYQNSALIVQAARLGLSALEDDDAATLLFNLRETPELYGPLLGAKSGLNLKARSARKRALSVVWRLRDTIVKARRRVINERARLYHLAQIEAQALRSSVATFAAASRDKERSALAAPNATLAQTTSLPVANGSSEGALAARVAALEAGRYSGEEAYPHEGSNDDDEALTIAGLSAGLRETVMHCETAVAQAAASGSANQAVLQGVMERLRATVANIEGDEAGVPILARRLAIP